MNDVPRRVFLSHTGADRDVAIQVADGLRKVGLDVLFDVEQLPSDEAFEVTIDEAIKQSDGVVVLVGSQRTPMARREWGEVLRHTWEDGTTPVVPVIVDDAQPPAWMLERPSIQISSSPGDEMEKIAHLLDDPESAGAKHSPEGERRLAERLDEIRKVARNLAETTHDA